MTSDTLLAAEARGHAATGWARQLRTHARITQAELATEVGVSRSTIAMWESGQRNPRGPKAAAYGKALRALSRRRSA